MQGSAKLLLNYDNQQHVDLAARGQTPNKTFLFRKVKLPLVFKAQYSVWIVALMINVK